MEILAEGDCVTVFLNGKKAASLLDKDKQFTSGTIGLYLENPGTVMEFRKIEIKTGS